MRESLILPLLILVPITTGYCFREEVVTVRGKSVDMNTKLPLLANVIVSGTGYGTIADEKGYFELCFKTDKRKFELKVFLIGYEMQKVTAKAGDFLMVELKRKPIPLAEVVVTGESAIGDEESEKMLTIRKLEVYQTPGASADLLYAMQMLPGVNAPPDGSSIFVRGGGPDEVLYLLDGIEVEHPFQIESPDESYFSIFDNQIIKSSKISTGSFSAQYGDALSGVVDIKTESNLYRTGGGFGIHMVGLNSFLGLPIGNKVSWIGSYKGLDSRFMEKLYRCEGMSRGNNAFSSLKAGIARNANIRLIGLYDRYWFRQDLKDPLVMNSINGIMGLSVTSWSKNWLGRLTFSTSKYSAEYNPEQQFQLSIDDQALQFRADCSLDLGSHWINLGADWREGKKTYLKSGKGFRGTFKGWGERTAFYVSDKFRLSNNTYVQTGIRTSTLDLEEHRIYLEPRVSVAYLATPDDILRLSGGICHQFGDYWEVEEYSLKAKSAYHYLLSYDRVKKNVKFRLTLYDKEYRNLFLWSGDGITNDGWGYARGAEFFIKVNSDCYDFSSVYNFLDSKRKEAEVTTLSPSKYEIDHSFSSWLSLKLEGFTFGLRYSFARGLPYTPLLRTEPDGENSLIPVLGKFNSKRCPSFHRLDASVQRVWAIGRLPLVVFLQGINILDRKNILRFEYSRDYSEKVEIESIFRRTFVLGLYTFF